MEDTVAAACGIFHVERFKGRFFFQAQVDILIGPLMCTSPVGAHRQQYAVFVVDISAWTGIR
jgi:hypothetical protein